MINKLLLPKAYVEVLEILQYIPQEDYNKIPVEIIESMKQEKDKEYKYIISNFDNFEEQEMLKETETILAVLFRDCWATEEQREKILKKEKYDLFMLEEEKIKKYNPDNIFKKNKKETVITLEKNELDANKYLIEYKQSFFKKHTNFIFKLFNIKK